MKVFFLFKKVKENHVYHNKHKKFKFIKQMCLDKEQNKYQQQQDKNKQTNKKNNKKRRRKKPNKQTKKIVISPLGIRILMDVPLTF